MKYLPKARTEKIVVQTLPNELLIYDLNDNRAFCLNETSAVVFNHCKGQTTFAELKAKEQLTDEIIFLALDGLQKQNLLDKAADYVSPFAAMNRREVIRKAGLTSMIALPVISTLVAPLSAHAASGSKLANNSRCSSPSDCASGYCVMGARHFPDGIPTCCHGDDPFHSYSAPGTPINSSIPRTQTECQSIADDYCCGGSGTITYNPATGSCSFICN